jgi:hypothetical protein
MTRDEESGLPVAAQGRLEPAPVTLVRPACGGAAVAGELEAVEDVQTAEAALPQVVDRFVVYSVSRECPPLWLVLDEVDRYLDVVPRGPGAQPARRR